MRNQIDFSLSPDDLFLNPAKDPGFFFLSKPEFWWRPHPASCIEGFAASADDATNARIDALVRQFKRHRSLETVARVNVVPVLLRNARFAKSYATVEGKCVLNGAAGARLLNRYGWTLQEKGADPEAVLSGYFARCQSVNEMADLPVAPLPETIDFAIECRNTFNYFHFMTETLCQLCVLDGLRFRGRIFIHFPNHESKTRAFTQGLIAALFPEFAGRVIFERAPKEYPQVLSAYSCAAAFHQMPPSVIGAFGEVVADGDRPARSVLAMNSFDTSLLSLRNRALAAIEGKDFSHLPRKFYITRAPGQSRERRLKGEESLIELLTAFGFATLAFEDLAPLEQIALMARAEVMVSSHGAGFANMLFANPDATIVEIGTLQTAQLRWGDFWPIAHAAGCRYITFFADHDHPNPQTVPDFQTDGIVPVHLSDRGLGRIMAYVATVCGHIPTFAKAADVVRLGGQLLRSGHLTAAQALADRHASLDPDNADLCLFRADLHKAMGEWGNELLSLHNAWRADSTRWQTLVQILWCARKLEKPDVQTWAVRLLQADFPARIADLARGRDWVQQLL